MSNNTIATAIAVIAALGILATAFTTATTAAFADPAPKVTICHVGEDEETGEITFNTITVSGNAVDKHIENHGDTLGPCPEVVPPTV